jgi:hypothetical protein
MKLRFSARGDKPAALVHLTVLDTLHLGDIVRRRGEALCRPKTSLPNLELLERQAGTGRPQMLPGLHRPDGPYPAP